MFRFFFSDDLKSLVAAAGAADAMICGHTGHCAFQHIVSVGIQQQNIANLKAQQLVTGNLAVPEGDF